MRPLMLILTVVLLAGRGGWCAGPDDWLLGHWPFDGDLQDASGKGHHAAGEGAEFVEGVRGQALKPSQGSLEIPNSPDLQIAPGLTIDCWVYFDEKPSGYQTIVMKEHEYQLRLDHEKEGGHFSFFIHLDGWEPRVGGVAPEAGRWYHLVAKWTGIEVSLEVDGRRSSAHRTGTPKPTENPVVIGGMSCRLDELGIRNPGLGRAREMQAMIDATPDAQRSDRRRFGEASGWDDWRAEWGATVAREGDTIIAEFPDEHAMLLNPALDVDTGANTVITLEARSPTTGLACVAFITDIGRGMAVLPMWDVQRTSILDLASHPSWRGRLKLLGISFPGAGPHRAAISNLWLSDKPEGGPFLYVRNFSPGRAILRAGREERVVAIFRNLGTRAEDVQAKLEAPPGVEIIGEAVKAIGGARHNGTRRAEWRLRAEEPTVGRAKVTVWAGDAPPAEAELALEFMPACRLPKASYVPPPAPANCDRLMLMHYCPLWKEGTHYGWGKIEPWPERKPAIGWYDEGAPEVADWHIKYALEAGIQGFIYCWYRADFDPDINVFLGHALHDGLMKARYVDQFKFTIMWENGCAKGVTGREDLLENVLPYWMENYFTHPSYVVIDNKPLLYVWRPERVGPQLGGSEATRAVFDEMREACRERGFDGLWIVGCVSSANEGLLRRMAEEGWDASSAYATWSQVDEEPGIDIEGIATISHRATMAGQQEVWLGKKEIGALPDIVNVMMGWDPRPWHGAETKSYKAGASPENFRAACVDAKRIVDATPGNGLDKRIVVFDNWDEFGEGHYLEPCSGFGFDFVDVIRDVFCQDAAPAEHIIPEDVGLEPPDRAYRKRREALGLGATRDRKVVDNLIAWWAFEGDDDILARDSSSCGFHAAKRDFEATEGIRGRGFLCAGGTVSVGADYLLFPRRGISIELWLKTDEAGRSECWILNAVRLPNTGYRLGFVSGKLAWQIPQTAWSHILLAPEPIPLGRWVHAVATFDNSVMRLFIDGEEVGALERLGALTRTDRGLCIGSYAEGDTRHNFVGALDEVRVYDRALSAEEIAERCRLRGG